jgi:hypothetical protein
MDECIENIKKDLDTAIRSNLIASYTIVEIKDNEIFVELTLPAPIHYIEIKGVIKC